MGPGRSCTGIGTTSKRMCCVTYTLLSAILKELTRRNGSTCRVLRACGKASLRKGRCRPLCRYTTSRTTGRHGGTFCIMYSRCMALASNAKIIRVTPTFNRSSTGMKEGCRLPFMRLMSRGNRVTRSAPFTNLFMGGTSPRMLGSLSTEKLLCSTPGFRRDCPRY